MFFWNVIILFCYFSPKKKNNKLIQGDTKRDSLVGTFSNSIHEMEQLILQDRTFSSLFVEFEKLQQVNLFLVTP